jgi:hypothetical protein
VNEAALAIGLVVFPPALVEGAVGPNLHTLALSDARAQNPARVI